LENKPGAGVIELLLNKFQTIDYTKAKSDIIPFIKNLIEVKPVVRRKINESDYTGSLWTGQRVKSS
jgi:hypothetical protein